MSTLDKIVTEKHEVPTPKRPKNEGVLEHWLQNNFRVEQTRRGYRVGLLVFLKAIYGSNEYGNIHATNVGVDRYLSEQRNFLEDFKRLIRYMNSEDYSPSHIHGVCGVVKKFFSRHEHKISDEEWADMKSSLLPSNVVATQDDILTKEQIRRILNHMMVHGRALTLFLLSTGARIGETFQLKMVDLNLDADPPSVNIRPQYTKKGLGGRVIWLSYEARDAIKEWFKVKDSVTKKTGQPFPKDMVFGFTQHNFRSMWWRCLDKTGLGQKDPTTGIRIYHTHTLRKFFSTQMSEAGVQESIIHAWMGHKGYLDSAYKRYSKQKLAEMYRDHMDAVSIYGVSADVTAFREKLDSMEKKLEAQQKDQTLVEELFNKYNIPNDRPMNERLVDLIVQIQRKAATTPQPSKVEPNRSSKPPSKPMRAQPLYDQYKKDIEEAKASECLRGIKTAQWDIACRTCRKLHFIDYKRCTAPQKPKGLPLKQW